MLDALMPAAGRRQPPRAQKAYGFFSVPAQPPPWKRDDFGAVDCRYRHAADILAFVMRFARHFAEDSAQPATHAAPRSLRP